MRKVAALVEIEVESPDFLPQDVRVSYVVQPIFEFSLCSLWRLLFSHAVMSDSVIPWTPGHQTSLSLTISQSLLQLLSIASVMPSSHLILWRPLLLLHSMFPSIRDCPMSWLFSSDDQHPGASSPTSVLPMSIQGWFPLRLTGLISLSSQGLLDFFSSTTVWRH